MAFYQDDFPALLLDFGVVVEDDHGTRLRGILSEQDVVQNDGQGDVVIRATTLTIPAGALPSAEQGDALRTWLPDAPVTPVSWEIRRVLLRNDGTPTRFVLVAT